MTSLLEKYHAYSEEIATTTEKIKNPHKKIIIFVFSSAFALVINHINKSPGSPSNIIIAIVITTKQGKEINTMPNVFCANNFFCFVNNKGRQISNVSPTRNR
jgi:hypothetical protein